MKMNSFNYALRYLLVLANTLYEEAYWDQVLINEFWVKTLTKLVNEDIT